MGIATAFDKMQMLAYMPGHEGYPIYMWAEALNLEDRYPLPHSPLRLPPRPPLQPPLHALCLFCVCRGCDDVGIPIGYGPVVHRPPGISNAEWDTLNDTIFCEMVRRLFEQFPHANGVSQAKITFTYEGRCLEGFMSNNVCLCAHSNPGKYPIE